MLKVRLIPTLLWKNAGLVKGVGFNSSRRVGPVLPAVQVYNTRNVDELALLDIAATPEGREPDYDSIAEFSERCFVPLAVGGGIRSLDHIQKLLRVGADKVIINTAVFETPELISKAAERFGSQCVVVSIDAQPDESGTYFCYSHAGTCATGQEVSVWTKRVADLGAGEILLTSIPNDGTMQGYDLTLLQLVAQQVNIPVIASGGAGCYEDFYQALTVGKATAVAAASMFHFTEKTPSAAKHYLEAKGVPVRH